MAEEDRKELETDVPESDAEPAPKKRPIEKFYDNFEGIPLKALDIFIGVCVALLIGVVVFGYIRSH